MTMHTLLSIKPPRNPNQHRSGLERKKTSSNSAADSRERPEERLAPSTRKYNAMQMSEPLSLALTLQ